MKRSTEKLAKESYQIRFSPAAEESLERAAAILAKKQPFRMTPKQGLRRLKRMLLRTAAEEAVHLIADELQAGWEFQKPRFARINGKPRSMTKATDQEPEGKAQRRPSTEADKAMIARQALLATCEGLLSAFAGDAEGERVVARLAASIVNSTSAAPEPASAEEVIQPHPADLCLKRAEALAATMDPDDIWPTSDGVFGHLCETLRESLGCCVRPYRSGFEVRIGFPDADSAAACEEGIRAAIMHTWLEDAGAPDDLPYWNGTGEE